MYEATDSGLTAWILKHGERLGIVDLENFSSEAAKLRESDSRYLALTWKDSAHIRVAAYKELNLAQDQPVPPLSFIGAPIKWNKRTLGVIRCCCSISSPYYFDDWDLALLDDIARHLGSLLRNWQERRGIHVENTSWERLVNSMSDLNTVVQTEILESLKHTLSTKAQGNEFSERPVFQRALQVTKDVIPFADIMDIRMLDPGTRELYFYEKLGEAWLTGNLTEITQRSTKRFRVDDASPQSLGVLVFQKGGVLELPQVRDHPIYNETFPSAKRMIIAPIVSVEGEHFGVLDIRSTKDIPFARNAKSIATLLGQQLGLFKTLLDTIRKLTKTERQLDETLHTQLQTYQDFQHQLRSPIIQARLRGQRARDSGFFSKSSGDAIIGLLGKATRVVRNIELFTNLARGRAISVRKDRITDEFIIKTIIEAGVDGQVLHDSRLTFDFLRVTAAVLSTVALYADKDLLEQALTDVVDNAYKYGFEDEVIRITCGLAHERFFISVLDRGVPIEENELPRLVERGFRGARAKLCTGEGSGIGLWIVNEIMKAQRGSIQIVSNGEETEVRLLWPLGR